MLTTVWLILGALSFVLAVVFVLHPLTMMVRRVVRYSVQKWRTWQRLNLNGKR